MLSPDGVDGYYDESEGDVWGMDITKLLGEIDVWDPNSSDDDLQEAQEYLQDRIMETENDSAMEEAIWQFCLIGYHINRHSLPRFLPSEENPWRLVPDGDIRAWNLYRRHYTFDAKKARANRLIAGPGFKCVLIVPDRHGGAQALFVWRLERLRDDGNYGACCAVFRNESKLLASELILWAEQYVTVLWPFIPRMYTFIDTARVKPYQNRKRPGKKVWGRTYMRAGWWPCGWTAKGLLVMEKIAIPYGAEFPWSYTTPTQESPDYWPQRPTHSVRWSPYAGGAPAYYREDRSRQEIVDDKQLELF